MRRFRYCCEKPHRIALVAIPVASLVCGVALPRLAFAQSSVEVLQEFDMEQVRVTDAYYQNAFNKEIQYLIKLAPDRLLAGFKAVSEGQDPKTAAGVNVYGGWEGAWSLLRGHSMGHYLTAMAQGYKQTKGTDATLNAQIKANLDDTITQLKAFQDKSTRGYLFASPEVHFDVVEGKATGDQWVPWYTMHKIIAGLLDVYKFEGNATALQIATKLGDWTYTRANAWDAALQAKVLGVEYGGMNDCLYELYKLTKNANHLAAAHKFDQVAFFTTISNGTNSLPGLHANTQIPKFVGALNRYRVLGTNENLYLSAAQQFWAIVTRDHTYVTGGNSENEHFRTAGQLDSTRNELNNETCNSYNMLKLARDLFKVTADVKYAQYYERTHLNEIMSAINPTNGMTTYFKPMGTGYFKLFGRETDTFWCCNGTGMENYTKLNDSVYFHNDSELYVNLYLSSTLDWTAKWFSMTQAANVPLSSKVTFTVDAAPTSALGIKFRKPYWVAAGQPISVNVNGQCFGATDGNGYLGINRVWAAGDRVELDFPADVQVSRLPDNKNAVAFTYGPVVLSAGLGTEQMVKTGHMATEKATIPAGVTVRTSIAINNSTTIEEWIKNIKTNLVQTAGKLEFALKNTDADSQLTFTPQYQRYLDRYGIYFKLTGTQGTAPAAAGGATSTLAPCGNGTGGTSAGGASSTGGSNAGGRGGSGGTNTAGAPISGGTSAGGRSGGGGANTGGFLASGGMNTGGRLDAGGTTGGNPGSTNSSTGGATTTPAGGTNAVLGGSTGTTTASAGESSSATGGMVSVAASGATASNGVDGSANGCTCTAAKSSGRPATAGLLFSLGLWAWRRNRRRQTAG